MRELRVQSGGRPLRVFYAFDPRRLAMGGELRVVAHFPQRDAVMTNFADAGDGTPPPRP